MLLILPGSHRRYRVAGKDADTVVNDSCKSRKEETAKHILVRSSKTRQIPFPHDTWIYANAKYAKIIKIASNQARPN